MIYSEEDMQRLVKAVVEVCARRSDAEAAYYGQYGMNQSKRSMDEFSSRLRNLAGDPKKLIQLAVETTKEPAP